MNIYKFWTQEEDQFLLTNYPSYSNKQLSVQLGRSIGSIQCRGRFLNLNKISIRKYHTNIDYFHIPNINNCYWAGLLAADGCIWKRGDAVEIGLQEKDKYLLEQFAQAVNYDGKIELRKTKPGFQTNQKQYRIIFYGVQQWVKDLKDNFNITPCKSLNFTHPNQLTRDQELSFIKGYIDGDGCVYCNNKDIVLAITGTESTLNWIKFIFDTIVPSSNCSVSSVRKYGDENCFEYRINSNRVMNIYKILKTIIPHGLHRKWDKLERIYMELASG